MHPQAKPMHFVEIGGFSAFYRAFPVDNHVDNVDFHRFHTSRMHSPRVPFPRAPEECDSCAKIVVALVEDGGNLL